MSHPKTKKERQNVKRKYSKRIKDIATLPNHKVLSKGYPEYVDCSLRLKTYNFSEKYSPQIFKDFVDWSEMRGVYANKPFFIKQFSHSYPYYHKIEKSRFLEHIITKEIDDSLEESLENVLIDFFLNF